MLDQTNLKAILFNFLHPQGNKKCLYLDEEQTLEMVIKNNMSLIRWGDGETQIIFGKSIYFQDFNENLKNDLLKLILNKSPNVLKCIPVKYLKKNILNLIFQKKLRLWAKTRYFFYKLCTGNEIYGDAFLFRPESKLTNSQIEKLWIGKKIILVVNEEQIFKDFSKKYKDNDIFFIKIKKKNAYEEKDIILEKIFKYLSNNDPNHIRVLVSAGPTAKIIVYEVARNGYIAYDMGHYFTWKFYNLLSSKNI